MASVLYVLHLAIPVDLYFITVSAIKALFVLFAIWKTFWRKLFPLLTSYKIKTHARMDNLSPLRKRHQESLHRPM